MIDGSMQDYPLTLDKFLRHAAKWHPDREVVTAIESDEATRTSYADLLDRAARVSSVLRNVGVKGGDRVATLAWNTHAHVEAWYAIMGMGAVCHTLNPRLTAAQLADMVKASDARVIVVSADLLPLAEHVVARASNLVRLLVIDGKADGKPKGSLSAEDLEPLLAEASAFADWGAFPETAPAGLCFTSGTTGQPKGVTYTHRSNFLHTLRILQADVMAFSGRDAVLAVVPMFHANAWGLPFAVPAVGGKLVLPGRQTDGASLARLIAAEDVTVAVGVPTVWLGLVDHLDSTGENLPSLKRIIVGGSPLAPALMDRLEQRLGVTVQTSWGMTELSPSGTVARPDDQARTAVASGMPAIGIDLVIADAEGEPLAEQRNNEGHLHVRGASVVDRYFGEKESAVSAHGWFPTGDLARIDTSGNLYITGRSKDLIKSGGEWINPAEIEAAVGALPQVSLAAVIGRPDVKWGERPVLVVELSSEEPISDDDLLAPLKNRVAPWWVPDAVIRLPVMPLASTGKIDKISLRERYSDA